MNSRDLSRRDLLRGSVALAAFTLASRPLRAFGLEPGPAEQLVPFLDVQPMGKMLYWQSLRTWITDTKDLYEVSHYGRPKSVPPEGRVEITGFVKTPRVVTLAELKKRRQKSVYATLECGGNGSSTGFARSSRNLSVVGGLAISARNVGEAAITAAIR